MTVKVVYRTLERAEVGRLHVQISLTCDLESEPGDMPIAIL